MLHPHPSQARFMSGKEARQLVRRHQEIDGSDNQQDDAEQGQSEFMGFLY